MNILAAHIRAVVFDLDNVLYNEQDYIYPAFHCIAVFLSEHSQYSEDDIYSKLVRDLKLKGSMYPRLFNDVVNDFGLNQDLVPEILKLFASVDSKITLFPMVLSVFSELRGLGLKLALVTNGNTRIQRNKIRLLGVEKLFDIIIYARETETGRDKPDPSSYSMVLQKLNTKAVETLCIGDNPYTDFLGAKQLGMRTLRVLTGEFKTVKLSEEYEADIYLQDLTELPGIIKQNNH